jgi:hypothetical protein
MSIADLDDPFIHDDPEINSFLADPDDSDK